MHLAHLRLRDFRNYTRLDADFSPGFHLLLGDNAQGKTNVLEAIYLMATLRSFRGVGKSERHKKGRHAEISAEMAMRAAKRLRLDGPASCLLHTIIENHLLMAGVSQRRDLDDPAVIRQFARQIQTPETLDLLTLLTFADSQGTSDKLWNGFKDLLLWQLHDRAMTLLTGGTEFVRASRKQRESLLQEVRELAPKPIFRQRRQNRQPRAA